MRGVGKIIPMKEELIEIHGEEKGLEEYNKLPKPTEFPPWWCKAYYFVPKPKRDNKFSDAAELGVFFGFDEGRARDQSRLRGRGCRGTADGE